MLENTLIKPTASSTAITFDNSASLELNRVTISGSSTGIYKRNLRKSKWLKHYPSNVSNTIAGLKIHNSILANTVDLIGISDGSFIDYSLLSDGQFSGSNNNISVDPMFSDSEFHLSPGSPAIDTGDPADGFANEMTPSGCIINIGAYANTLQATASSDPDTDGDGLTDHCESLAGTDINLVDTDFDGLNDGIEDANSNGAVDIGETNPQNPDTDNDGFSDGYEIAAGSDPLDQTSVPTTPSGDINGDGLVNIIDLLMARQILSGEITLSPSQYLRADVAPLVSGLPSPNGTFDLGDILIISRKVMGDITF